MLEIQKLIRQFPNLSEANLYLKNKLNLKIKVDELSFVDGNKEEVYIYNYDQIDSPKFHPIIKETRALILDIKGNVVSFSFPRFFNYRENPEDNIDWETARAETKHDGSLIVIYNHRGNWFVQTRQSANAEGTLSGNNYITYNKAVVSLLEQKCKNTPFECFRDHYCYAFEFVSPFNRIVTPYSENNLYLLSIFNKQTLTECDSWVVDDVAKEFNFSRPAVFDINGINDISELLNGLNDLDEGFVIVDGYKNRIKMKSKRYLSIAKTINAGNKVSPKNFAEIVLTGETDEILTYFPEFRKQIGFFEDTLKMIEKDLERIWRDNKNEKSQKEFAISIKNHPFSGVLFDLRSCKISSINEGIRKIKPKAIVEFASDVRYNEFKNLFNEID